MHMPIARRRVLLGGAATAAAVTVPPRARAADDTIRVGVLTDMNGVYAANTGPGSVLGARMAVEDFTKQHPNLKVDLVSADLQLKPDVALAIAADWFDNKGVDVVTDVPRHSPSATW
jgi:branched-chain amino acid transport system substrate-binding protein